MQHQRPNVTCVRPRCLSAHREETNSNSKYDRGDGLRRNFKEDPSEMQWVGGTRDRLTYVDLLINLGNDRTKRSWKLSEIKLRQSKHGRGSKATGN